MLENDFCPIWSTPIEQRFERNGDYEKVDSPRAGGRFKISGTASHVVKAWNDEQKVLLTNWLVTQRRLGVQLPAVTSYILEEIMETQLPSVFERADNLLRFLNSRSDLIGSTIRLTGNSDDKLVNINNIALALTSSRKLTEIVTLAEYCAEKNWVQFITIHPIYLADTGPNYEFMLKPTGYAHLAQLDSPNQNSRKAFVAMWFNSDVQAAYDDGIAPAILETGYIPVRVDQVEHSNKIDDQIIAEIKQSRFVVADFTSKPMEPRGGVYYEAGFAQGLGIPVIWTCRSDVIEHVHFDTRQFNHIVWTDPIDLKKRLINRILAVIGKGSAL